ncbi:MIF4G domain protein (macronuclear) [Tetrahymena thermophila SB210]|uniref:MIF4G domain protein n=1 Tax=Tetrahymena thermophila (strain SB210) TaxID=312017 RepID=I7MDB6_TETTS|nr:MIF4G domain protein [Tetrahymena thermophila SB210]EAR87274.1 MIF4G domain protein [Tetrahymena thermophila SB210]|eukprot:XP_001007519.1 MIF4G domain protein [Tetrahymena thermophila SB210]
MNNKPKPSGEMPPQSRNQRFNSQNYSQQSANNSNFKNSNYNNNKKRYNNHNNNNGKVNNSKTFEYVRKVDTAEGQEELRRKQQQLQEEERLRQENIKKQQLEEEERLRELELQRLREQERLEQLELLKCYIEENIIMPIFADAEKHAQQRSYLKSFEGLNYLLSTNFIDFEDEITQNIPIEIQEFNARQYESFTKQSNLRRRHQTSYSNQSYQDEESNSSQQQRHGGNRNQRVTVRQTINNFQNNKNQNYQIDLQTEANSNRRHQNNRNRNLTLPIQPDSILEENQDSKWRQIRTPLFSQSQDELKFLLNIVTPDNFNNLKDQFFQLCQRNINKCIFSLISKVCKEAKYTKLYAQMAIYIQEREEEIEKANNNSSNIDLQKTFKGQMFAVLQDLFYDQNKLHSILSNSRQTANDLNDEEESTESNKKINSKQEAMEKKSFNLFLKFLGELFLSKFLPKKIISYIIQTMIHQYICGGLMEEDRNLEGIILLIDSIGPEFENCWNHLSSKQIKIDSQFLSQITNQFCERTQDQLDLDLFENQFISFDGVMNILRFLKTTDRISKRIQILIVNLNKRWENKWKKALHQKEDPRTKEEIRNQHFNELNRRQQEIYENLDYTKEVKRVFLQLDNNLLSQDECLTQITQLGISNVLQSLFSTFFDARIENLSSRYQLMSSILFETDKYQYTTFLSALNNALNTIYSQACDFPHLNDSFVNILCPMILNGYLELGQIKPTLCGDPDEDEDKNYFFQQFKNDCVSYLKSINYFMIED